MRVSAVELLEGGGLLSQLAPRAMLALLTNSVVLTHSAAAAATEAGSVTSRRTGITPGMSIPSGLLMPTCGADVELTHVARNH